jgi:hypothetical protein
MGGGNWKWEVWARWCLGDTMKVDHSCYERVNISMLGKHCEWRGCWGWVDGMEGLIYYAGFDDWEN